MIFEERHTRFRAYRLDSKGASFSYWNGAYFTLCEARLKDNSLSSIYDELRETKEEMNIDTLHITSWDEDHCKLNDLRKILSILKPNHIEVPGYAPDTATGKLCLYEIKRYLNEYQKTSFVYNDDNILQLEKAKNWAYVDVIFGAGRYDKSNDNSSIKIFRTGCFTVLSLGDVESAEIANFLMDNEIIQNEVDILILPHHGADDGFITDEFLGVVQPRIAIALCDEKNEYDHPSERVKQLLKAQDIPCITTKTNDILIESVDPHTSCFEVKRYVSSRDQFETVREVIETKRKEYFSWWA